MKKIIISILTLATVLCATAQTMTTKAIVVYQKDGQRDTLMWKQAWAELMRSYIYGIENPADDDYITLTNTRLNSAAVEYRLNLTYDGRHAPYDEYSVVLSPDHITKHRPSPAPLTMVFKTCTLPTISSGITSATTEFTEAIP